MRMNLLVAGFLLLSASGARAQQAADSGPVGFTPEQIFYLINEDESKGLLGAELRAQYLYHFLKKDRDPQLNPRMPPWLDQTLDAMLQHPVWRDPEQGILNEAQLWQGPVAVLYEFFQTTRKTFPQKYRGGAYIPPTSLISDYEDSRTRFQIALERLYRAHLGDSMGGRGRTIMANYDLILREMNSLLDALTSGNDRRYIECVMSIAYLTRISYNELYEAPRGYEPPGQKPPASTWPPLIGMMVGMFLCFSSAWGFGTAYEEDIYKRWEEFLVRSRERADDFNRQFIQVKVQYLVFGPIAVGFILGLFFWLTVNVYGFILLMFAGIFIGIKFPLWALNFIRRRRGQGVERQLMDAMILLSNCLKSGLDIVQGFQRVSLDLLPPISEEFGLVIKNYQLGTPFDRALQNMEARIESRLLSYVIKAIIIQRAVGGNLTKIFDRIVDNIREEGKLEEKVQSLTAQQRIQSVVVGILPWGMVALMFAFQPEMMIKFYFTLRGVLIVLFCVLWMSIGMGFVRKLADIQV